MKSYIDDFLSSLTCNMNVMFVSDDVNCNVPFPWQRPSRDLMLNDYIQKKQQMGTVLRNPEEQEKLKR